MNKDDKDINKMRADLDQYTAELAEISKRSPEELREIFLTAEWLANGPSEILKVVATLAMMTMAELVVQGKQNDNDAQD